MLYPTRGEGEVVPHGGSTETRTGRLEVTDGASTMTMFLKEVSASVEIVY